MADLKERVGGRYFPNPTWVNPNLSASTSSHSNSHKHHKSNNSRHNFVDQGNSEKSHTKHKSWTHHSISTSPSKRPSLLDRMAPSTRDDPAPDTVIAEHKPNPHRSNGFYKAKPKVEESEALPPPVPQPVTMQPQLDRAIEDFLNSVGEAVTQQHTIKTEVIEPDLSLLFDPSDSRDAHMSTPADDNHGLSIRGQSRLDRNNGVPTHNRKVSGHSTRPSRPSDTRPGKQKSHSLERHKSPKISRRYPDDEASRGLAKVILPEIVTDNLHRRTEGNRASRHNDTESGAMKLSDSENVTAFINVLRDVGDEVDNPPPRSRSAQISSQARSRNLSTQSVHIPPQADANAIVSTSTPNSTPTPAGRSPPRGPRALRRPSEPGPVPLVPAGIQHEATEQAKSNPPIPPSEAVASYDDPRRQSRAQPDQSVSVGPKRAMSPPRLPARPPSPSRHPADAWGSSDRFGSNHRGRSSYTGNNSYHYHPTSPRRDTSRENPSNYRHREAPTSASASTTSAFSEAPTNTSVHTFITTPRNSVKGFAMDIDVDRKPVIPKMESIEPSIPPPSRSESFNTSKATHSGSTFDRRSRFTSRHDDPIFVPASTNRADTDFGHKPRIHPDRVGLLASDRPLPPRPAPTPQSLSLELPAIMSPTYRTRYFERRDLEKRRRRTRGDDDYNLDNEGYDETTRTKWVLRDPYHPRFFFESKEERRSAAVYDLKRAQRMFGSGSSSKTSHQDRSHMHRPPTVPRPPSPPPSYNHNSSGGTQYSNFSREHQRNSSLTGPNAVGQAADGWGAKGAAAKDVTGSNSVPLGLGNATKPPAENTVTYGSRNATSDGNSAAVASGNSIPNLSHTLSVAAQALRVIQGSQITQRREPDQQSPSNQPRNHMKRKSDQWGSAYDEEEDLWLVDSAEGSSLEPVRAAKKKRLDSSGMPSRTSPPPFNSRYSDALITDSPLRMDVDEVARRSPRSLHDNLFRSQHDHYDHIPNGFSSTTVYDVDAFDESFSRPTVSQSHRDVGPRRYSGPPDTQDHRRYDSMDWVEGTARELEPHRPYEETPNAPRYHQPPDHRVVVTDGQKYQPRAPPVAPEPDSLDTLACHRVPGIWFVQSMASDSLDLLECKFDVDEATIVKWDLLNRGRQAAGQRSAIPPSELFGARRLRLCICSFDRSDVDASVQRLNLPRPGEDSISPQDMVQVLEHLPQKWPSKGGLIVQMMPIQPLSGPSPITEDLVPLNTWLPHDFDYPHKPLFIEEHIREGTNTVRFISLPLHSSTLPASSPPPAHYVFALRAFVETTPEAARLAPILHARNSNYSIVPPHERIPIPQPKPKAQVPPPKNAENGNESDDDLYASPRKGARFDDDEDMNIISPAPLASVNWF